ncbi:MAG TPA: prepilin-type N-terminal cleavage/methylation domain-containing protein [Gemmatimonadales bacterium]|nr:prepilin-type N-terminal cleavage/methylation domain-containing protein [Gemmatimonadales bacterium]
MKRSASGFTIVEVLVSIVVLTIGVIALAGSSAMVTRMIGRGKVETRVAQAASFRLEALRLAAYSTLPRCTAGAFANGGPVTTNGLTESWTVTAAGKVRTVQVTVSYRTVRGPRTSSLQTRIEC